MAACGWSERDLVQVSGASRSLVSQWLGKASRPPKTIADVVVAHKIANASGFEAPWIAQGVGAKKLPRGSVGMDSGDVFRFLSEQAAEITDAHNRELVLAFLLHSSIAWQRKRVELGHSRAVTVT